ncbi:Intraflagellar transport protein 80-like protein [Armadillidium vulgare]|nr:Intraflagellar transport protein 80-like protein [Armadillidium vulgare]
MRFKITLGNRPKHTDVVTGVGWMSPDEVYTCGDDHILYQWNLLSNETNKVAEFGGLYPTELHWLPKGLTQRNKISADTFLLTAADGKFHIINKLGRIEKSVEAHKGACLTGRWSGEDGLVKIWSRSGMLRSAMAQASVPIYSAAWSPDSDAILYTSGTSLIIKPLAPNSKPIQYISSLTKIPPNPQWKAHDGIILKVGWNPNSGLIVSGAEDTRYKVWDNFGRQLYASSPHHHPITSVSWSPDGQLFAVGSYNTIRLCDKAGWCHALEKPNTGSIFNLAWSTDGTQVAGACGNGHVLFAHIIDKHLEWKNYEATVINKTTISLRNVTNEAREKLELRDRIINAYIYSTRNWNTPIIFDLKEASILYWWTERVYWCTATKEGKSALPKWQGMRTDVISQQTISLSNDTVAIRNKADEKVTIALYHLYFILHFSEIHFFNQYSIPFTYSTRRQGKPLNDGKPWMHKIEIKTIALDQVGQTKDRKMAVVDRNSDLYLVPIQRVGGMGREVKLGGMIHSLKWCDNANQLASLHESALVIWYYPAVAFVDRDLLMLTMWRKDGIQKSTAIMSTTSNITNEFGKNADIDSFVENTITIRRLDGSIVTTSVSPYPALLHSYVLANKWDDALRLARFVKEDTVWACLAGFATSAKELETAEIAYAAIDEADKVRYIQYIKEIPVKEAQQAEMALLGGHIGDAESILLQAGLYFRAIILNINTYQFERALQLAIKYKTHVDTVLAYRMRYTNRFGKKESSKQFLQYEKEVEVNWDKIQEKIEEEYQMEREKPRS